jgi:hypothetical protein
MNLFLKRPDLINGVMAMSGVYDLTEYTKGIMTKMFTSTAPSIICLISRSWHFGTDQAKPSYSYFNGSGDHEDPEAARRFAGTL